MKKIFYIVSLSVLIVACGGEVGKNEVNETTDEAVLPNRDKLYEQLLGLHETMLYDNKTTNKLKANELHKLSLVFLARFNDDDARMEIMEYGRAAATGTENHKGADRLLKMMIEEFPEHQLRPEKMSLRGFTLWKLGDIAASTRMYKQIIKEYPDTEWATDAEGSLMMNNLDTDDGKLPDYFDKPNS